MCRHTDTTAAEISLSVAVLVLVATAAAIVTMFSASDKTKTAPFPLGLQRSEGRCDYYGLNCSPYEYSWYDYDCKLSVAGQYNYDYNCCNCHR